MLGFASRLPLYRMMLGLGRASNVTPPVLGANPVVGSQLGYTAGTWTGATSVSAQAQRRLLSGIWANVGAAWNASGGTPYTLVDGDFGYTFRVIETATPGAVMAASNETNETTIIGLALRLDASNAATLWQDAAGTVPATAGGDVIGRWSDVSPNGFHATQATTANKPTLQVAVQNGRNVVRGDGTNDALNLSGTALALFQNKPYGYIFAAWNPRTTTQIGAGRSILGVSTPVIGTTRLSLREGNTAQRAVVFARRLDTNLAISAESNTNHGGTTHLFTVLSEWAAGTLRLRQDGVQVGSGNFATSGNSENTASAAISIFGTVGGAGAPSLGDLSELIVFTPSVILSSGQITAIEAYLNAKWAVY